MKTEQQVREEMRSTGAGRFLLRYGFEPYDTESSARRVAEKAARDLEYLAALMRERDEIEGTATWDRDPEAIEDFRTRWIAALANTQC